MTEGPIATRMREKLTEGLAPKVLVIEDDSARHAGHHHEGGIDATPGGESHFNIEVVSAAFEGMGRLERQKTINRLLAEELAGPVHALSIKARAMSEIGDR